MSSLLNGIVKKELVLYLSAVRGGKTPPRVPLNLWALRALIQREVHDEITERNR